MTPMEPKELANDGGSEEMCDRDSSSIRAVAAELLTSVEFGFLPDTASGEEQNDIFVKKKVTMDKKKKKKKLEILWK